MIKSPVFRIAAIAVLAFVGYLSIFTVSETEQALVLTFGNPKRTVTDSGLHFKQPWQQVLYLDKRILNLDIPEQEVIAVGQDRLVVDAFARYRIIDPLLTYQRVRNELGANQRLQTILSSNLRQALGEAEFATLLSEARVEIMRQIRDRVDEDVRDLGLQIVDVRIRRADLPEANSNSVYQRMRTAREREAREIRAQGNEQAQLIEAAADRERTVLLAEAERTAQEIRGRGDAEATRIFAEAYSQDPEFFSFYRSMQAYLEALNNEDTRLIISPNSEFFQFLRSVEANSENGR